MSQFWCFSFMCPSFDAFRSVWTAKSCMESQFSSSHLDHMDVCCTIRAQGVQPLAVSQPTICQHCHDSVTMWEIAPVSPNLKTQTKSELCKKTSKRGLVWWWEIFCYKFCFSHIDCATAPRQSPFFIPPLFIYTEPNNIGIMPWCVILRCLLVLHNLLS